MRIAAHSLVVVNPIRPTVGHALTPSRTSSSSSTSVAHPIKPTNVSLGAPPATSPFASIFQTFSQTMAAQAAASASATAPTKASTAATAASTTADATAQTPGISALVSAIMNGTFHATNVTDPSQLQETTPWKTDTMPSFYYASDDTANQLAQLLGGTVVKMPPFGQSPGWNEPLANFIQLPNGQTVNAADLAYYGRCGVEGAAQLTADLTATINEGAALSNYYTNGGQMPTFATGYVGPPITGMTYASGAVGADGMVINPAMQGVKTNT